VKLTWDQDDPNRVKVTRRTLTREEIDEQDFKTYLASSGSESEDEGPVTEDLPGKTTKSAAKPAMNGDMKGKKAATKERTAKLRSLLLAANDEDGDIWGKAGTKWAEELAKDDGDVKGNGAMEITFKPALSTDNKATEDDNLTTLERYRMRVKEKKAKKKEKIELKRAEKDDKPANKASKKNDDFFGESDGSDEDEGGKVHVSTANDAEESGSEGSVNGNELKGDERTTHFSMKDIFKAEKEQGKRRKRKSRSKVRKEAEAEAAGRGREVELGPDDWKINVKDPRFKVLHEEADFAIDPSNPQ